MKMSLPSSASDYLHGPLKRDDPDFLDKFNHLSEDDRQTIAKNYVENDPAFLANATESVRAAVVVNLPPEMREMFDAEIGHERKPAEIHVALDDGVVVNGTEAGNQQNFSGGELASNALMRERQAQQDREDNEFLQPIEVKAHYLDDLSPIVVTAQKIGFTDQVPKNETLADKASAVIDGAKAAASRTADYVHQAVSNTWDQATTKLSDVGIQIAESEPVRATAGAAAYVKERGLGGYASDVAEFYGMTGAVDGVKEAVNKVAATRDALVGSVVDKAEFVANHTVGETTSAAMSSLKSWISGSPQPETPTAVADASSPKAASHDVATTTPSKTAATDILAPASSTGLGPLAPSTALVQPSINDMAGYTGHTGSYRFTMPSTGTILDLRTPTAIHSIEDQPLQQSTQVASNKTPSMGAPKLASVTM